LIDDKTLLQADAAVIAGVLILLTILLTVKPFEKPKGRKQGILQALVAIGLTGLIALFSVSAITTFYEQTPQFAAGYAILGFFWLIGTIAAIVWVSVYRVKEPTFTGAGGRDVTNKSDKEWLAEFVAELRKKQLDKLADVLVEEIKKEHLEQEE
jgi:hypothetical protein